MTVFGIVTAICMVALIAMCELAYRADRRRMAQELSEAETDEAMAPVVVVARVDDQPPSTAGGDVIWLQITDHQRFVILQCYQAQFGLGQPIPDIMLQVFYRSIINYDDQLVPIYGAQRHAVWRFALTHRLPWLLDKITDAQKQSSRC